VDIRSRGAARARTPQETFQRHTEALIAGDIDGIVSDYVDDARVRPPRGVLHGKDGVRQGFETLLSDLPDAEWAASTHIFRDEVLFIEWGAASEKTKALDGVDTFVFADGKITVRTVRYTVEPT
jgi:hypothetical protein